MKKGVIWTGAVYCTLVLTVACGQKNANNSASSAGGGALAQLNNAPFIKCSVTNKASGEVIMEVSNLTQVSDFPLPPVAPVTIDVNCANSIAADGSAVTSTLSLNAGAAAPLSGIFEQTFSNPGQQVYDIKVTDSKGVSSETKFTIPVSCNPLNYTGANALSLDTTKITWAQGSYGPGYLNVTLPSATGGTQSNEAIFAGYYYAIDINGDGRFDDYNQNYWNSTNSTFSNMYTLYNGARTLNIAVFDVACSMEKIFTVNVDFSSSTMVPYLPAMQTGPTASDSTPYFYLQGQVDALNSSGTVASDGDAADTVHSFDAMEGPADPKPIHVLCTFDGKNFNISGMNTYSDGSSTDVESQLQQSMQLRFSDQGAYEVTQANPTPPEIDFTNIALASLTYETAASPDGVYNQYQFAMDSSCTSTGKIIYADAITPCAGDAAGDTGGFKFPIVKIVGTFTCPHLTAPAVLPNPNTRAVSITNGYYFCEVGPINQCIGGGGQGSGGVPPPSF